MSFAQGINFRATSGYVTDGTSQTFETATTVNYPRTTAQGNTVGYESITGTLATRDRATTPDPRLAGVVFVTANGTFTYRVDLPSPGTYRIYGAVRETVGGGLRDSKLEILDDATVLVTAWDRASLAALNALGIDNTIYATGTAWLAAGPTYRDLTFASTIARFRISKPTGGADNRGFISSLFIEQLSSPPTAVVALSIVAETFTGAPAVTQNHHVVALGIVAQAYVGSPRVNPAALSAPPERTVTWPYVARAARWIGEARTVTWPAEGRTVTWRQ